MPSPPPARCSPATPSCVPTVASTPATPSSTSARYVAHGRWSDKPDPSPALRGHILAHVFPCDPDLAAEWDDWYDAEHLPDMMASDAFTAGTRWRRRGRRATTAPNHVTLYDVGLDSIDEAVARSAAVMPGLIAAGRKHRAHTGALTLTLVPAGRYGGAGYRSTLAAGMVRGVADPFERYLRYAELTDAIHAYRDRSSGPGRDREHRHLARGPQHLAGHDHRRVDRRP